MNSLIKRENIFRDILCPVLLIILLGACFLMTTHILWKKSMDECYNEIELSADDAVATLKHNIELYQGNLELLSGMIASDINSDHDELKEKLKSYCSHQQIDALCVQLHDGTIISEGDSFPDYSALPSFSQMQSIVPFISGRFPGKDNSDALFIYQAVPIQNRGHTIGILYGFMNIHRLKDIFESVLPYGGNSQLYIVDGDTGDFLMDMWHDSLGNIYDGSMGTRETKSGYNLETMLNDIKNGNAGYYVFISRTAGEYFYTRYQPVGINNWSLQLTVLESVAFESAKEMNCIIIILGCFVTAITAIYIFTAFCQHRRRLKQKQEQIHMTTFMFEVQQTLFDSHKNPELMTNALKIVAKTLEAEGALFIALNDTKVHNVSIWRSENSSFKNVVNGKSIVEDFPVIYNTLLQSKSILYYKGQETNEISNKELEILELRNIQSIMLTPVLDAENTLQGILCSVNLNKKWNNCSYLECVSHSFMMAINNIESYQIIHDMGTTDILTGMKNRNSYEAALLEYANIQSPYLSCTYIDVNGLHELNNQFGHKAGDNMLCFVAECIHLVFNIEDSYRIGGDEFVIFSKYEKQDILSKKLEQLKNMIEAKNYHISVGTAYRSDFKESIEQTIVNAEAAMYRDKQAFYSKSDRRVRKTNN